MNPIHLQFNRKFQIWSYTVSHGQLLFRSTKSEEHKTQVDVLFKDTALVQAPASFFGLTVREIWPFVAENLNLSTGLLSAAERRCFEISGDHWKGVIVAGNVFWSEEDAEYFTESRLLS